MSTRQRSFVDAHAPHGRACNPCSHASTSTRANVAGAVGPRPSASLEDPYVQEHRRTRVREDHPERQRQSPRKTGGCRGDLRSRRRPAQRDEAGRLCSVGTSRRGKERDVSLPAVLRERRTPEFCVAAPLDRGSHHARCNSGLHPRRVQPPRACSLNGQAFYQVAGTSPAAWDRSADLFTWQGLIPDSADQAIRSRMAIGR